MENDKKKYDRITFSLLEEIAHDESTYNQFQRMSVEFCKKRFPMLFIFGPPIINSIIKHEAKRVMDD